jgi:uncharacterized protein YhaN
LRSEHELAKVTLATSKKKRVKCRQERDHFQRLKNAWEPSIQRRDALKKVDQMPVIDSISIGAADEFRNLLEKLKETQRTFDSAGERLDKTDAQLAGLRSDPKLIELEGPIRQAVKQLEHIRKSRHEIPRLEHDCEKKLSDAAYQLERLLPNADLKDWCRKPIELAVREKIEQMVDSNHELTESSARLDIQSQQLGSQLDESLARLSNVGRVDRQGALAAIMDQKADYTNACDHRDPIEDYIEGLDEQIEKSQDRLHRFGVDSVDSIDAKLAPTSTAIEEMQRRFNHLEADQREAQKRLDMFEAELAKLQVRLKQLASPDGPLDRETLEELRKQRDRGWSFVVGLIEGQATSDADLKEWLADSRAVLKSDDPIKLPNRADQRAFIVERYARLVLEVDRAADLRLSNAKLIAEQAEIRCAIELKQVDCDQAKAQVESLQQKQQDLQSDWSSLWSPLGITAGLPEEMLVWLETFNSYNHARKEKVDQQAELDDYLEKIEKFESDLAEQLGPERSDQLSDPESLWQQAGEKLNAIRAAVAATEQLEEEIVRLREKLREVEKDRDALDQQKATWSADWNGLVEPLGLDFEEQPRLCQKIVGGLEDVQKQVCEADEQKRQLARLNDQIAAFEKNAKELSGPIAPELGNFTAEDTIDELASRLEQAKQADRDLKTFSNQRQTDHKEKELAKSRHEQFEQNRLDFLRAADVSENDQFLDRAEQVERRAQLTAQIEQLDQRLDDLAMGSDRELLLAELEGADIDQLTDQIEDATRQVSEAEKEYDSVLREEALLKKRLSDLSGESQTMQLAQKVQSDQAELGSAIDRYAPLVLAESLLNDAIEKFQLEHQPALLSHAEEIFSQMTLGRHKKIVTLLNDEINVEGSDGKIRSPDELSTGTRQQLYLAIRLASIIDYADRAEPLPLVMDDVLVNFDRDRARKTIRVLGHLSSDIQILFLTCHQSTVELICEALDSIEPTML